MEERREFLKGSLIVAGAAVLGNAIQVQAATMFPKGLIYTKESTGRWAGKEGAHAPVPKVQGNMVTITTPHPMTKEHFIVKHTLVTTEGQFLGEKIFTNTDPAPPESSYKLPDGFKGTLWATSFCNVHDFWVTEFTV